MQKGVAGSGLVVLGSLAGCNDGGDGNGNGNGSDGSSMAGDTVPAKAEAVVSIDVEAMLNDDDLRDVGDTALEELQQFGQGESDLPSDVDSAIEMAREEADLDPTGFRRGTLFMQVEESGADEDYAGMIMETDWSEDDLITFLESEGDSDLEESDYSGKTIYSGADTEEGGMAVLSDGRYVIGPTAVLEDVIDVVNGDAEAVESELMDLYDETTEGHVQFATVVPEGSFEDMDSEEIEIESLDQIEYMSGSVYKTDSDYGVETNLWAGDAASQLKEDIEFAIDAASRLEETSQEVKTRLEDVQVVVTDQTVTVSYEEDIEQVKTAVESYIEENLMGLLFLLAFSGGGGASL